MASWFKRAPRTPRCPHDRVEPLSMIAYASSDWVAKLLCLDCAEVTSLRLKGTVHIEGDDALIKVTARVLVNQGYIRDGNYYVRNNKENT